MLGMNPPVLIPWVIAVLCWSLSSLGFAGLVVVHDSGQTRPLEPLLSPLLSSGPQPGEPARADGTVPDAPAIQDILDTLLPVRSPGLQSGVLADTRLKPQVQARLAQGNPPPFFLVGSDELSLRWLAANAKTLREIGAVGLLVQADTQEDIRRVVEAAQGLSVTPGSGSDLARVLGIRHYPVLITKDGLMK